MDNSRSGDSAFFSGLPESSYKYRHFHIKIDQHFTTQSTRPDLDLPLRNPKPNVTNFYCFYISGITVVLAISVFLSIISEMLPRSSQEVPYVTIYLFALYVVSVLTVLDSVLIVFLYHVEEVSSKELNSLF